MPTGEGSSLAMARRFLPVWVVLFLVPALPVIAFYVLFSQQNYFELQQSARGIVASGPIAAYVALVWIAWEIYKRIAALTVPELPHIDKLTGGWRFTASSYHGSKRQGRFNLFEQGGDLRLSGTFELDGKNIGHWKSTMTCLEENELSVVYSLEELRSGQNKMSRGMFVVHFDPEALDRLEGTWVVLGESEAHGDIVCTKAKA
jgi:hypothetical protein